jgi:pimeloyl-ACP methyl ester carboxylesterase
MKSLLHRLIGALLLTAMVLPANAASGDWGVVLLHGKEGMPQAKLYAKLRADIQSSGFKLIAPEMAWSHRRIYDADVADSMVEIERAIADLHQQGASKFILIGHSMGSNAALRFTATHTTIEALVLLAPGHNPEQLGAHPLAGEVERARKQVGAGKGSEKSSYRDINVGHELNVTTTAAIYLSWFDPSGDAVMPKNAARIPPTVSILEVIGSNDPLRSGQTALFSQFPQNPHNQLLVVEADHKEVPDTASTAIIDWLKSRAE